MGKFSQLRRTGRLPTVSSIGKIGKLALLRTTGNCMSLSENVPDVTAQLDQASRPSIRIIGSRSSCWQHEFRGRPKGSEDESLHYNKKFRLCLEGSFVKITVDEILSRCQLFAQVDPVRRSRLAQVAVIRKFAKGTHVFHEGDPCPGVYVVGSGSVRVFKTGPGGKEHVLHMIGVGQTFAEVAAIGGFPCPASAEATAATTTVLIPYHAFRTAISDDHQLCLEMMTGLSHWVKHLIGLMEDIVLRDATGRVARFLLDSQAELDGTIRLPGLKRHIASHLNLTSETFSRTLSRLIEAGLVVEHANGRVELCDRPRLQAASEGFFPLL